MLLALIDDAEDDITKFRSNMETWFNDAMARVSGWYKRKTQLIIFFLATVVTVLSNADTIQIVRTLSNDSALREALVAQAQEFAKQDANKTLIPSQTLQPLQSPSERIKQTMSELGKLGIPLAWDVMPKGTEWVGKVFGLLLTVCALSLGAPFWFDMLKKVVNIRAAGTSPAESTKSSGS